MQRIISFIFCTLLLISTAAFASGPSPIGVWETYDLDHVARSYVRFYMAGSHLQARIIKLLPNKNQTADDVCTVCPPPWKDKKKVGIVVVSGLKEQTDGTWTDGTVLDTDTGKSYHCQISLAPDGQTMYFHAYVAMPALGKTIDWVRVE